MPWEARPAASTWSQRAAIRSHSVAIRRASSSRPAERADAAASRASVDAMWSASLAASPPSISRWAAVVIAAAARSAFTPNRDERASGFRPT